MLLFWSESVLFELLTQTLSDLLDQVHEFSILCFLKSTSLFLKYSFVEYNIPDQYIYSVNSLNRSYSFWEVLKNQWTVK